MPRFDPMGPPSLDNPQPARGPGRAGIRALFLLFVFLCGAALHAQMVIEDPPSDFRILLLGEAEDPRPAPSRAGPLKVLGLDDNPALRAHVEQVAFQARARIRQTTRADWEGTALVVWVENPREYRTLTGKIPEFTAAAASAARRTVWINASAWRRSDPRTQLETLTHEFGHLLLGNLPGGTRLPLWAEEGVVMHLAGEWNMTRALAVSRAHAFGQLPSLVDLETTFPEDPEMQALAYAVSYLTVAEIAASLGDAAGAPERLMRRLSDAQAGPRLREALWDPAVRDGWEAQMLEALGGRVTNLMIALSSGTAFWFLILVLVFWAWSKKRARRRAANEQEAREEAWAASLTERDIHDVWGEPQDDQPKAESEREELPWEKWERLKGE